MSRLYQIAGLETPEDGHRIDSRASGVLRVHADVFLRSGGNLTLSEWSDLDANERAAFLTARRKIDVERAVLAATAAQGPDSAAEMMSEIDGGESAESLRLERAVSAAAERSEARARREKIRT